MATIDKNFRIKNGLVVEGTTGTINGQTILTETGGDTYILNLVGGATLVKSVESTQLEVSGAGKLSVKSGVFDAAGAAAAAQTAAEGYADSLASNYDAAGDAAAAEQAAKSYADGLAVNYDPAGSAGLAEIAANDYTDGEINSLTTTDIEEGTNLYFTNQRALDATSSAYDAAGAASTAQTNAEGYADSLIDDTSIATTKIWSAYKTSTEIAAAQQGAEDYTDTAVSNLVNGAPELLDTLNELAQALQDNPDIISDLQDVAAGKQDTLTAGSNIDITGTTISVTGLDSADISDFNTAALSATSSAYDAAGAASTAQTNAESYADGVAGDAYDNAVTYANGLAGNYDAAGAAGTAESNANSYTDAEISDVLDGTSFFTSINVNDVASQVAATTGNIVTAAATTAIAWAKADYRSAKFLVKVKNGNHTQVSDLVVTLDTSDNIGVSEYGITYSNGTSLADVSADVSGANVRIRVTPVNANTEVVVVGTLIK
jgi:hypothetical protein